MKPRSPLVALFVVSLCLAGVLPPSLIKPGAALSDPSQIGSWSVAPGGNPTVILGRTEIDFRLLPIPQEIFAGYYIYDTASTTEILRDDDRSNWIADERYGSIAVDVAGDSEKEIITVTPANNLRCLRRDGTADVWNRGPYGTNDQLGCPALYDFDGDGNYEVIFGHFIYPFSANDELVIVNAEDGTVNQTVSLSTGKPMAAPVIGDVDNDGDIEIVIACERNKRVYSINPNGTIEWQATLPATIWSSPIIGDFDADGEVEVVAVTDDGRVCYLSGSDGSLEKTITTGLGVKPSPVAADVNNDGYLEVIIAGNKNSVVAIDKDGNKKVWSTAVPTGASRSSTPAIADTNGDGVLEVIVVDSHIRVLYWTGDPYTRTPGSGWQNNGNSPVIFDSDNSGLLDIVYFISSGAPISSTRLYKVTTTTSSSQKGWPTFKNDFRRSGVYGSDTYGVDPDMIIDNLNWSYGNISKGSMAYKDFTISSVGKASLIGSCSNQAKITFNDTSQFTLSPGSSKGFRATFDTTEQGIHTGYVLIITNDPDEPRLNATATANITQPEHDIAVYKMHVADQLNPNYVNVPPIKVEFKNIGQYWEGAITTNMTIDGILATPLTTATFNLNPGEARNVTFYWNRTDPALSGEGTFTLVSKAQNVNLSIEGDTTNNVYTKNVEVKFPISIDSVTSYLAQNLTYYVPQNTFSETDYVEIGIVLSNEWDTTQTIIVAIQILDATGSSQGEQNQNQQLTLLGGQTSTVYAGFQHTVDISSDTKYNATVSVYDRIGGGVMILADPYVHNFWVQPT